MADTELVENQAGIVSEAPEPGQMENEVLAVFVRDGLKKFAKLVPYVRELKARFAALPRGKADILGCRTWKEFCETVLDRTPSAVRKALANDNEKTRRPQVLMDALELVLNTVDEDDPRVRFSVGENGNVLVSSRNPNTGEESEVQLDVKAPTPDDFTLTFSKEDEAGNTIPGTERTVRGSLVPLPYATFDVTLNPNQIIDALEQIDGDPAVIWSSNLAAPGVRFSPNSLGELRFLYQPNIEQLMNKWLSPAEEPKPQQYIGDFLPELRPGDEVTIAAKEGSEIRILKVKEVTPTGITTDNKHSFNREGDSTGLFQVLRIATDEDRQRVAAQQAEANERARKEAEFHAAACAHVDRLQSRVRCIMGDSTKVPAGYVQVVLTVNLEQLRMIADVLNPLPTAASLSDDGPDSPDDLDPEKAPAALQVTVKEP